MGAGAHLEDVEAQPVSGVIEQGVLHFGMDADRVPADGLDQGDDVARLTADRHGILPVWVEQLDEGPRQEQARSAVVELEVRDAQRAVRLHHLHAGGNIS